MTSIQSFIAKSQFSLRRRSAIATCPHIAPLARLKLACSRHQDASALIFPLVEAVEENILRLRFAGYEFEVPLPADFEARKTVRNHFSQVVAETFIAPLFFYGPVNLQQGNVVFDLGGNIGTTAALFSKRVGTAGKVFAFEPCVPHILERNSFVNGLSNVEVLPVALGDSCGSALMSMGSSGMDSTLVNQLSWHKESKKVPVVTLDQFVLDRKIERVNFIKMDIEGAEESALLGACELIKRDRPKWSISSYHTDFVGEKQHKKLVILLQNLGYTVKEIPGFHIYAY